MGRWLGRLGRRWAGWYLCSRWARIPIGIRFAVVMSALLILAFTPWIYWSLAYMRHAVEVQTHLVQTRQAHAAKLRIEQELFNLLRHAEDYSVWEDAYAAVRQRDLVWLKINLTDWLTQHFHYDIVSVLDMQGKPIIERGDGSAWLQESVLVRNALRGVGGAALKRRGDAIYLVSATPIYDETLSQPPVGVLLLGRSLNRARLNQIVEYLEYPNALTLSVIRTPAAVSQATSPTNVALLRDENGHAIAQLTIETPGDKMLLLKELARILRSHVVGISLTIALATSLALVWLLRRHLARFLSALQQLASGKWDTRVAYMAHDEFGIFAQTFNTMAHQLEQAFEAMEQQRKAMQAQNEELHALYQQLHAAHAELAQLNAELMEANRILEQAAVTDGLTGLKNHRAFQEALHSLTQMAERSRQPLSLIMLDVDHFKQFNDTFGHPAGDELLCQVARVLRDSARAYDVVARYGGEEFALLLPNTTLEQAVQVAERLRQQIHAIENPHARISASLGVATYRHGTAPATLLYEADTALYQAKRSGRNQVRIYHPEAA